MQERAKRATYFFNTWYGIGSNFIYVYINGPSFWTPHSNRRNSLSCLLLIYLTYPKIQGEPFNKSLMKKPNNSYALFISFPNKADQSRYACYKSVLWLNWKVGVANIEKINKKEKQFVRTYPIFPRCAAFSNILSRK